MNIQKEDTGDLTATIKVQIEEKDYTDSTLKVLKDYQRKANMPGFRPGKVPFSIIKKMYGKAVIADEVNKLLSESINKYLTDNKIEILGHPLPSKEKTTSIDFENQKEFDFYFDIGMAPKIDLQLSEKIKVDYYQIKVDDKTLKKYKDDIVRRNGNPVQPDASQDGDIIRGTIEQLDPEGDLVENGVKNETPIGIDFIKDKTEKKKFLGLKKGDVISFNPLKATASETESASMLGIDRKETGKLQSDYRYTVSDISRIEPATIDKELFKKVFPKEEINTEEDFDQRLKKEIGKTFETESDREFVSMAVDKLIEVGKLDLPESFMKRWLIEQNNGKLTPEEIDKDFGEYIKSLQWQLIQNHIIKSYNIKVEEIEVRQYVKDYFMAQSFVGEETEESKQRLESIVDSIMENKEEIKKITDQLYDVKIKDILKTTLGLNKKSLTYDNFIKSITNNK